MTISPPERGTKAKVFRDRTLVPVDFDCCSAAGHFDSQALAKGPKNHHLGLEPPRKRSRFRQPQTSDLLEGSFPQDLQCALRHLAVIFILAQRAPSIPVPAFSTHTVGWPIPCTSAHVRRWFGRSWPKRFFNARCGAGFPPASRSPQACAMCGEPAGFTNESSCCARQSRLGEAGSHCQCRLFSTYHKAAPKLEWFQNVESVLHTRVWPALSLPDWAFPFHWTGIPCCMLSLAHHQLMGCQYRRWEPHLYAFNGQGHCTNRLGETFPTATPHEFKTNTGT